MISEPTPDRAWAYISQLLSTVMMASYGLDCMLPETDHEKQLRARRRVLLRDQHVAMATPVAYRRSSQLHLATHVLRRPLCRPRWVRPVAASDCGK